MNYTVNQYLNVRIGSPSVNAPKSIPLEKGAVVEVVRAVEGEAYDGNKLWFEGADGKFYWSGGFAESQLVSNNFLSVQKIVRKSKFDPVDPSTIPDEKLCWSHIRFGIKDIWKQTYGQGVKVAILDSGINSNHPDLKDAIIKGWNFLENNDDFSDETHSHGTEVAGIIASQGKQYYGIAPGVELLIGKIYKDYFNKDELVLEGIKWALKNGAEIINMSFTFSPPSERIQQLILASLDKCVFVAACGNAGGNNGAVNRSPASYKGVISVGALNEDLTRYGRSSYSDFLDVMAPGVNIVSSSGNDAYAHNLSDTSFATPFITGILALAIANFKNQNKQIPFIEFERMIQNACYHLDGNSERNIEYGYGIIDAEKFFK